MVAKIESGKSLTGAFYYNENKVNAGKAQILGTNGYIKSDHLLSLNDRLFRLTDLAGRNIRTKTNTVHLSLNFDINENIEDSKLANIADDYMKRIGFEFQPYLIYKHNDAGHPHIHVLTTNIQSDGKRISLNDIGKLKSEPARKAIEDEYGLVKASHKKNKIEKQNLGQLKPVEYGKSDTMRAITNVVSNVTKVFKYASLPELNAILKLYNVTAYQGSKDSTMYKHGGLNYWVLNDQGIRVGVPIKASSIYQKPTMKTLEQRFKLNEYLRKPFKSEVITKVDRVLAQSGTLAQFSNALKKAEVTLVVRQNAEGRVYGLSYIDHLNKAIFNGSDLGKAYSAGPVISALQTNTSNISKNGELINDKSSVAEQDHMFSNSPGRTLLDDLLNPYEMNLAAPNQFGPQKKKKKRRKLNL